VRKILLGQFALVAQILNLGSKPFEKGSCGHPSRFNP
jgi:hypothetical protein